MAAGGLRNSDDFNQVGGTVVAQLLQLREHQQSFRRSHTVGCVKLLDNLKFVLAKCERYRFDGSCDAGLRKRRTRHQSLHLLPEWVACDVERDARQVDFLAIFLSIVERRKYSDRICLLQHRPSNISTI